MGQLSHIISTKREGELEDAGRHITLALDRRRLLLDYFGGFSRQLFHNVVRNISDTCWCHKFALSTSIIPLARSPLGLLDLYLGFPLV